MADRPKLMDQNDVLFMWQKIKGLVDTKVDKVAGKDLISIEEIARLAQVDNYDDTAVRALIATKVDAEEGKGLISLAEIERLASVDNYDDTEVKADIAKKVDAEDGKGLISLDEIARLAEVDNYDDTEVKAEIAKKVDAVEGYSLVADTEIARLANVDNYDDTDVKADIAKKVDAEDGKGLISLDEIARLAEVDNYDDTAVKADIKALQDAGYITSEALEPYYTKTEVDAKITSAVHYKGTVEKYSDLPTENVAVGDMYNVQTADAEVGIHAGDNVVWSGTAWDIQAGTIDTSNFLTTSDVLTLEEMEAIFQKVFPSNDAE